jgi:hypothetical protein
MQPQPSVSVTHERNRELCPGSVDTKRKKTTKHNWSGTGQHKHWETPTKHNQQYNRTTRVVVANLATMQGSEFGLANKNSKKTTTKTNNPVGKEATP